MRIYLRLFPLLASCLFTLTANAQANIYQGNGTFRPTTSEERYHPPVVQSQPSWESTSSPSNNSVPEKVAPVWIPPTKEELDAARALNQRLNAERLHLEAAIERNDKILAETIPLFCQTCQSREDIIAYILSPDSNYYNNHYGNALDYVGRHISAELLPTIPEKLLTAFYTKHRARLAACHQGDKLIELDRIYNTIIKVKDPEKIAQIMDGTIVLKKAPQYEKYGYSNGWGIFVITPEYDYAYEFTNGYACVKLMGKYGQIDSSGKVIIPAKYEEKFSFNEGIACVKLNSKYGYIDIQDKAIIPFKYDIKGIFIDGFAVYDEDNPRYYYIKGHSYNSAYIKVEIDKNGNEYRDFYEGLKTFRESKQYGLCGFISRTNEIKIPAHYDSVSNFQSGVALVKLNQQYGFIDTTGKVIIPIIYSLARTFYENKATVTLNGRSFIIDREGREEQGFTQGLSAIRQDDLWGYKDTLGKVVIPIQYTVAGRFFDGMAAVALNGKYGYIDRSGKAIIPFQYDMAGPFNEGLSAVKMNGKYGFIDNTGKTIIPFKYDEARNFSWGMAKVTKGGKTFEINKEGKNLSN